VLGTTLAIIAAVMQQRLLKTWGKLMRLCQQLAQLVAPCFEVSVLRAAAIAAVRRLHRYVSQALTQRAATAQQMQQLQQLKAAAHDETPSERNNKQFTSCCSAVKELHNVAIRQRCTSVQIP
jgi:hypothetical protein